MKSTIERRRIVRVAGCLLATAVLAGAWPPGSAAQPAPVQPDAAPVQTDSPAAGSLREQIDRRFIVVPVPDGLVLRPRTPSSDVRWIEVSDGAITVNGAAVTGAELRDRVGSDAPLVLQLSYLDAGARRAMFPDTPAAAPVERPDNEAPPVRRGRNGRGMFRMGGDITVGADESVAGDVVAVGGSLQIHGEVRGNVAAVGGNLELGPAASVRDVLVIGGTLQRAPTARVTGEVVQISPESIPIGAWSRFALPGIWWGWWFDSVFALMSTLIRVGILCLLAALVILLAREQVERVSLRAAAEPLKSGAIGLLAQLLFLPLLVVTILILVVTIIGIPLLLLIPFVLVGLGVVALVGFTAVAYRFGRLLAGRVSWLGPSPYAATVAGILVLVSPLLIARLVGLAGGPLIPMTFGLGAIGLFVEYVAWTVGFGAVALARFSRPSAPAVLAP